MRRDQRKGIFCLEGDWWGVKDFTTVEPVLRLLETAVDYRVPYIHRDVGTRSEFDFYLKKWKRRSMSRFPILYLGFHGATGLLYVGEGRRAKTTVTLEELAQQLEGECSGRVIHFGSCATLSAPRAQLNSFLRRTQALAICGYGVDAYWMQTAAFEVLLLGQMQEVAFTKLGMRNLEKGVRKQAPGLARLLKFRMAIGK